jgi:hypothetical protein
LTAAFVESARQLVHTLARTFSDYPGVAAAHVARRARLLSGGMAPVPGCHGCREGKSSANELLLTVLAVRYNYFTLLSSVPDTNKRNFDNVN